MMTKEQIESLTPGQRLIELLDLYWRIWKANSRNYSQMFANSKSVPMGVAFLYDELNKGNPEGRIENLPAEQKKALKEKVFRLMPGCSQVDGMKYAKTIYLIDNYDQIQDEASKVQPGKA